MSKIWEIIRDKSIESIIEKLIFLLWLLIVPTVIWFRDYALSILQFIPKVLLLLLSLLFLSLTLLTTAYIIRLNKKIKNPLNDYQFDSQTGFYKNKKTNELFCSPCLLKNVPAQLKEFEDYWRCTNCGHWYYKPGYTPKSKPKRRQNPL